MSCHNNVDVVEHERFLLLICNNNSSTTEVATIISSGRGTLLFSTLLFILCINVSLEELSLTSIKLTQVDNGVHVFLDEFMLNELLVLGPLSKILG